MQNNTEHYETPVDLIVEDPFNNNYQAKIYLSIDWENESVWVDTYYNDNSTPSDVWHGLRSLIELPNNVDATCLYDDVQELMPRITKIAEGYESIWDGHNWKGKFSDESAANLEDLKEEIQNGSYFSSYDEGGLLDVREWFVDPVEELTANTTDEEIKQLAEKYDEEVHRDNVVIRGGVKSICDWFTNQRDEMIDEADASKN